MAVDISGLTFTTAWNRHRDNINAALGARILGAGGATWRGTTGQQSCALRMSIALSWAGVIWPTNLTNNVWRLQGTNVYFPTLAGDYPDVPLLADAETIDGTVTEKQAAIADRNGVIYFGGNFPSATGHLTLWDGTALHYPAIDTYWTQPNVYFWEMA